MTPEMIARARKNAAKGADGKPIANVEFHLATIDKLPLPDASADCVISNCVINLVPDKRAVFREVFRVLKPGGRMAISDLVLKKPLPPELADDLTAYVGCLAGAIGVEEYRSGLREAGFGQIEIVDTGFRSERLCQDRPRTCPAAAPVRRCPSRRPPPEGVARRLPLRRRPPSTEGLPLSAALRLQRICSEREDICGQAVKSPRL